MLIPLIPPEPPSSSDSVSNPVISTSSSGIPPLRFAKSPNSWTSRASQRSEFSSNIITASIVDGSMPFLWICHYQLTTTEYPFASIAVPYSMGDRGNSEVLELFCKRFFSASLRGLRTFLLHGFLGSNIIILYTKEESYAKRVLREAEERCLQKSCKTSEFRPVGNSNRCERLFGGC